MQSLKKKGKKNVCIINQHDTKKLFILSSFSILSSIQ